jgi:hypothetical protein
MLEKSILYITATTPNLPEPSCLAVCNSEIRGGDDLWIFFEVFQDIVTERNTLRPPY